MRERIRLLRAHGFSWQAVALELARVFLREVVWHLVKFPVGSIGNFIGRRREFRRDPAAFRHACNYCGKPTKRAAYTSENGNYWPSCCSRYECIGKWEPVKKADAP